MSTVKAHTLADVTPALSLQPMNFAAKDPGVGGWRPLLAQGVGADKAGIDRLVVSDHVILGENLEKYGDPSAGGTEGGVQPTGSEGHWLDPLTVISMWAATTTHTRFTSHSSVVEIPTETGYRPAHTWDTISGLLRPAHALHLGALFLRPRDNLSSRWRRSFSSSRRRVVVVAVAVRDA